jgi:hypothetical protein
MDSTTVNQPVAATGAQRLGTAATRALHNSQIAGPVGPDYFTVGGLMSLLRDNASDAAVFASLNVAAGGPTTLTEYVAKYTGVARPSAIYHMCVALVQFGRVDPELVAGLLNDPAGQRFIYTDFALELENLNGLGTRTTSLDKSNSAHYKARYELSKAMRAARAGGPPADPALVLAAFKTAPGYDPIPNSMQLAYYYSPGGYISDYIDELVAWKAMNVDYLSRETEIRGKVQSMLDKFTDDLVASNTLVCETSPEGALATKACGRIFDAETGAFAAAIRSVYAGVITDETLLLIPGISTREYKSAIHTCGPAIDTVLAEVRSHLNRYCKAIAEATLATERVAVAIRVLNKTNKKIRSIHEIIAAADECIAKAKHSIATAEPAAVAEPATQAAAVAEPAPQPAVDEPATQAAAQPASVADIKAAIAQLRDLLARLGHQLQ